MADSDMIERLEKQIEGSNLALAAVAEVLHKMDSRLSKAEEEDIELSEMEADEIEKQEIIKAVAGEVYGLIKADSDNPTGAQWGTDTDVKAHSMTGTGQATDKENAVTVNSKTEDANRTIQAMQKQIDLLKESLAESGYDVEKAGYGMANQEDGEDDPDAAEARKREEDKEEDPDEDEFPQFEGQVEQFAKQITDIQKAVSSKPGKMQKMIQDETENRLRKMGFREENGLNKPQIIRYDDAALGVDASTPIRKSSNPDETVDQMMQLSYQDLRRLQEQVDSGDTDGVPRELLGY